MHTLEIVRAGAGSGKTTDLCRTVEEAVAQGLDPARLLATTFTRKAAAELKGRILARLLAAAHGHAAAQRQADRLELAAIGTVHSVAHQLLSRYALELGLSPRLQVLTEQAGDRALRDLLGRAPAEAWQPLADCADRLGLDGVQRQTLSLLAAKRGNRINDSDFTDQMAASADRVCELLAPAGPAKAPMSVRKFYQLVERALQGLEALTNDTTQKTLGVRQKLRQLRAQRLPLWGSYLEAGRLTAGSKSGANDLLDPLRNHAAQVRENPALHADLREFARRLAAETIRLDEQYRAYKAERGLVDFTDLETLLLDLLENESLTACLAEDFDLVLVDEFQDTNPLQLAIFERLRRIAPRSRWVGDPKQAIYGFRDTDPELVNELWNNAAGAQRAELPHNHRSQRGLVQLVGALFSPVFGAEARQNPRREALPRGVERWVFDSKNQQQDALALACGLARLHTEGIRFGDIVVLERTNRLLQPLAAALDELGIPYLLESAGLLSTREGALVLAGLRLVADRRDSLAAATILHFLSDPEQETPAWLSQRLQTLRGVEPAPDGTAPTWDGFPNRPGAPQDLESAPGGTAPTSAAPVPWDGDPRLASLERIDRVVLSPTLIAQQVIEALELPRLISTWGEPSRRGANLDSLLRHAREYEESALDGGQSATLSGLILYLEDLAGEERDVRYPPPGHDAVTLITYHSAKGLEWPVVVLSGLNSDRDPNLWSPIVTGGSRDSANRLEGRTLRAWTWPFGQSDGEFGGRRTGSGLEEDALHSPEGQERARRESDENLRLLYVGCTRAKHKLVFAHRDGKYAWLKRLAAVDMLLDVKRGAGQHRLPGLDTSLVVRRLNADMVDAFRLPPQQQAGWLAWTRSTTPQESVPRYHSPSSASGEAASAFHAEELPGPSLFPVRAKEDSLAAIGDAVHSYLAALPSLRSLSPADQQAVAERCLAAYAVTGLLSPTVLVACGERFCQWVETKYPGAMWHTEVAVTGSRSAGGQWRGTADLLLQLPQGEIVIVDHKSAPLRRPQCLAKARAYAPQLAAYWETLHSAGEAVSCACIHFPLAGIIAMMESPVPS